MNEAKTPMKMTVLLVAAVAAILSQMATAQTVVCQLSAIEGFDRSHRAATAKLTANTTSIAKMQVYITVEHGYLYLHSNFISPKAEFPTKIATNERVDLDKLLRNLVGRNAAITRINDIRIYVDKNALDASTYNLDFRSYKKTTFIDRKAEAAAARRAMDLEAEQARLRRAREKEIERAREEAAARAAEARRRQDKATIEFVDGVRVHRGSSMKHSISLAQSVKKASNGEVAFFATLPHANATEIVFPDKSVFLFADEIAALRRGERLPSDHPLTVRLSAGAGKPHVLYTENNSGDKGALNASDAIAFGLQRSYPEHMVFRDPFSDETARNAAALAAARVAGPQDFVTIIAEEGFSVTDWNMLRNIQPELSQAGFNKFLTVSPGASVKWVHGSGKCVLVVSGHMDSKLTAFLEALGEAGVFRGNYVLLNTCNTTATRDAVSRITQHHQARAVFAYSETITASQVEGMLLELATSLKSAATGLVEIVTRAMKNPKLHGIWSICKLNGTQGVVVNAA